MAAVDVVIPSYRGMEPEANQNLLGMLQATNCNCRDPRNGAMIHDPWKCPNGKHHVRMLPPVYASSVVHWARNQAVSHALYGPAPERRPKSEYLFLMDDDMVAESNYLSRLIGYKLDIVCGICTIRRDPPRPNIRFWKEAEARFVDPIEWDWDSTKLMEIDGAGAAFMLVKRTVFERMAEAYVDCEFERAEDLRKHPDSELINAYWDAKSAKRVERFEKAKSDQDWRNADCWWFQFLDNADDRQVGELGEDLGFCWKAKKLGFKIYADPQVIPGHIGKYGYSIRDYREYVEVAKQRGELQEGPMNVCQLERAEEQVAAAV